MNELKTAWLAGLIDGEGTVIVNEHRGIYSACIGVQMTSQKTIREIRSIFIELGANAESVNISQIARKNKAHKNCWHVRIRKQQCVYRVASALEKFSVTKMTQLGLVKIFCKSRMERPKMSLYSELELAIYSKLKSLNRKGIL